MTMQPTELNLQRAWAPFEPDAQRPWSRGLAAHLHRRAGFAGDSATLDATVKLGPNEAVDRLCNPSAPDKDFESTSTMLAERTVAGGNPAQLSAWWVYRMLNAPDSSLEKLTLFWHGHFATSAAKVDKPRMMLDQNELLRQHARGKFESTVRAISRDPAMLIYLDSTTNRRIHPNENFARELMELFTLGVGNYSERDIKEVARAFTGFEVLGDVFRFDKGQHDVSTKTFLGHSGNFGGDDAVQIILNQPAAAQFIARKLIRFFVFDEPVAPDALVEPIARELREREFEIGPVVQRILRSNLFYSERSIGQKVRSPVELMVGVLRALDGTTNLVSLAKSAGDLGQTLFQPPNVKGWDGARAWINTSTLLGRINAIGQIMSAPETRFGRDGADLGTLADAAGATSPAKVVDWLLELLVAVPIPLPARDGLIELARDGSADRDRLIRQVVHAMSALPEFQLC